MELIADNSIPKYKWELKRTCFDRLEAIVWACFRQYRSTTFCLMKHLKDIALFFDCSERTIRRALNDGAYIHKFECGAKLVEVVMFSAERLEQHHRKAWESKGRKQKYYRLEGESQEAFKELVRILKTPPSDMTFVPSLYAARAMVMKLYPNAQLPCVRTLYNYAKDNGKRVSSGLNPSMLRSKPAKSRKKPRQKGEQASKVGHTYAERPPEVVTPTELGHFEGDTVVGPIRSKGVVYSFIDRVSGYPHFIKAPDRTAKSTLAVIRKLYEATGHQIRSITFDRGCEFNDWKSMEEIIGNEKTTIYYADAYCSWQRGRNENIHRFLRRVLPKKKTLYHCSQEKLDRLTQCIRDYPRRIFNGLSARENHNEKIRESVSK